MTKVILVRHGQTIWNLELKYQGHSDIALTETGLAQANLVAERLAAEKITAVYASDLSRAFITAEKIAEKHRLPVIAEPAFREFRFGDWEGLTHEGISAKWPDIISNFFICPDQVQVPGGETFRELKERAVEVLDALIVKHPGETIVVVTHGGTIRAILCAVLNIHLNFVWNIRQDNTAVNIIEYYQERAVVTLMNDIHHLKTHMYDCHKTARLKRDQV